MSRVMIEGCREHRVARRRGGVGGLGVLGDSEIPGDIRVILQTEMRAAQQEVRVDG